MNKPDMVSGLRAIERDLAPELRRAASLPEPPRQPLEAYAPRYQQSDDEIDPVVKGLLTHLPPAGSIWPAAERKLWLDLLEGTFRMIFRETEPVMPSADSLASGPEPRPAP